MKLLIAALMLVTLTTAASAQGWIQRKPQCRQVCNWESNGATRVWVCRQICD